MSEAYFCSSIVAASGNQSKIGELQMIASDFGIEILAPQVHAENAKLGPPPEVEETEDTYRGNAQLKANAFALWAGVPVLADDSGLEVDALEGRPGVHSARYGGEGADDEARWRKVLRELELLSKVQERVDRSARFHCSLVLAYPNGSSLEAESTLEGYILEKPQGSGGFGYDPIVYVYDLGMTLAEMEYERTCREGFRAKAASELFRRLKALE